MLNFRRYVVLISSIILFSSFIHTMHVKHPASYSLYDMMLKKIVSDTELHCEFNNGAPQLGALNCVEITYIAETLRAYNQYPMHAYERLPNSYISYTAGSFKHNGSTITLGSNNGMLNNFDTSSGIPSLPIVIRLHPIQSLAYSSDDTRITAITQNHSVSVYDAHSGTLLAAYPNLEIVPDHVIPRLPSTMSSDAGIIAAQRNDFTTELWHIDTDSLTLQSTLPTDESAKQLCLSPDASQLFVVKSASGELYDIATDTQLFTIPYHMEPNVTFSSNGAWIVAACRPELHAAFITQILMISTEDSDQQKPIRKKIRINRANTVITAIATNNDCTRIAMHLALPGISNYRLNIINTQTTPATLTHSLRSPWRAARLILSPDESHLAAIGQKSIALWDLCLNNLVTKLAPEHGEFLLKACQTAWDKGDKYPIDHTDEHYQHLIRNISLFRLNAGSLFALNDPTTDEESPSPKRARIE